MSGDGITSNELASIAGDAVNGTLMTFPPDPRNNPNAADAVKKFRDAGFEPEAYTLYSYAALQIIAEAAKAAGSTIRRPLPKPPRPRVRSRPSSATSASTPRATSPVRTTRCTPGRRAPTASTPTSKTSKLRLHVFRPSDPGLRLRVFLSPDRGFSSEWQANKKGAVSGAFRYLRVVAAYFSLRW